jgi:hypothetical protein
MFGNDGPRPWNTRKGESRESRLNTVMEPVGSGKHKAAADVVQSENVKTAGEKV